MCSRSVSYTHLDVYKRQDIARIHSAQFFKVLSVCGILERIDFVAAFYTELYLSLIHILGEGITGSADFTTSFNDWREYTGYAVKKYAPLCYCLLYTSIEGKGPGEVSATVGRHS